MPIELIAEVASSHGGSVPLAKEFIQRYAAAGADFVKFQHTRVRHLRPDDPQHAWFTQAELQDEQFAELKACCEAEGTKFLTTVFNAQDVPAVTALGCRAVKLGAGEWEDAALVTAALLTFPRVLRSFHALRTSRFDWNNAGFREIGDYLATVTRYPASVRASLRAIARIGRDNVTGYSDHSIGTEMAEWAIDCGAKIVEVHVSLPHQARDVRAFEKTVRQFQTVRAYANDAPDKYIGRWQWA